MPQGILFLYTLGWPTTEEERLQRKNHKKNALGVSSQGLGDHRSAQFATHGTDFWVTLPRWSQVWWGTRYRTMCVVAERDSDVTIYNERLDLHHTFRVKSH